MGRLDAQALVNPVDAIPQSGVGFPHLQFPRNVQRATRMARDTGGVTRSGAGATRYWFRAMGLAAIMPVQPVAVLIKGGLLVAGNTINKGGLRRQPKSAVARPAAAFCIAFPWTDFP